MTMTEQGDDDDVVTPPATTSAPSLPLTPPPSNDKVTTTRVQRLLAFCKSHREGRAFIHLDSDSYTVSLHSSEYDQFRRGLKQDPSLEGYVKEKIRFV